MDKENAKCNLEKSERHSYKNERGPETISQHRIIGSNIYEKTASIVRKKFNDETG